MVLLMDGYRMVLPMMVQIYLYYIKNGIILPFIIDFPLIYLFWMSWNWRM